MTAALTGNRPALPAQWPAALSPACLEVIDNERLRLTLEGLLASRAPELQTALERIDKETSALLDAALDRLRSSFGRHVQHLFGEDGRGAIEVDTDGRRPTGVRIRLQPPAS